jgi:DNA-binding response OmpR family regulator
VQPPSALDILVVDDDEPLREMLTRSFEREGHRVTAVADGEAAIAQATERDFDVVLLDVALGPGPAGHDVAELRSRIRAVLRRAHGRVVDGVRSVGPVTIDQRERQVTVGGAAVRVTFSEYELLACLMERPGKLFTRQELLRAIWGDSAYRDPRAIDVHIRHLREKLEERPEEPSLILTVRGAGYRFREQ